MNCGLDFDVKDINEFVHKVLHAKSILSLVGLLLQIRGNVS